jgi:excisionase family DNA binding protein
MGLRRLNPRLIKLHRSYAIDEAARVLGVHKNTVASWLRNGLHAIDDRRPILIQGRALRTFLEDRNRSQRRRCGSGELYCLKCRAPRRPVDGRAIYTPLSDKGGNLQGRCPDCSSRICRRVSAAQLRDFGKLLNITFKQARSRLNDRSSPCLDCWSGDE